jgi:hypothetical protein
MSAGSDVWAEVYVGTDFEPDLKDVMRSPLQLLYYTEYSWFRG